MSDITTAIGARQAQIAQLQNDIETLQRAAGIMGGGKTAPAKSASESKPKSRAKPTPKATAQPKKKPRAPWSAARRQRMKKYWTKRRKAKG